MQLIVSFPGRVTAGIPVVLQQHLTLLQDVKEPWKVLLYRNLLPGIELDLLALKNHVREQSVIQRVEDSHLNQSLHNLLQSLVL